MYSKDNKIIYIAKTILDLSNLKNLNIASVTKENTSIGIRLFYIENSIHRLFQGHTLKI